MPTLNARIKAQILGRIRAREWLPGDRIPSEQKFCELFGASRMTVNRALRELAEQGYLTRTQGSGTYVAEQTLHATLLEIRSIRSEIEVGGRVHRAEVLGLSRRPVDVNLAVLTGLEEGAEAVELTCLHFEDDVPIQLETRYADPILLPGFEAQDFTRTTASDYIMSSLPITEAEISVTARSVGPDVAELLALPEGAACLAVARKTYHRQRVISFAEMVHPGAAFALVGRLPGMSTRRPLAS